MPNDTGFMDPGSPSQAACPADTEVSMSQLVLPNDTNLLGNLMGGRLLHWLDIVGALAATRHARRTVATVCFDSVVFCHPVRQGEMVTLRARVVWAGRTSLRVIVRVEAENLRTGAVAPTNHAFITFVALDDGGRPCPVPGVRPATAEDEQLFREAQRRHDEAKKGGPA